MKEVHDDDDRSMQMVVVIVIHGGRGGDRDDRRTRMMMGETRSDLAAGAARVMGTSEAQVTRDLLGPW